MGYQTMIENHAGTATLKQLINRRIGVVVFLGFASGLPLALSRSEVLQVGAEFANEHRILRLH